MSNRAMAHRRVQSTLPASLGNQFSAMGQFAVPSNIGFDLPQGFPRGHGRRHSVNVINNKGNGIGSSTNFPSVPFDNYEEEYSTQPGISSHSRQSSHNESSWRISKCPRLLADARLNFVQTAV